MFYSAAVLAAPLSGSEFGPVMQGSIKAQQAQSKAVPLSKIGKQARLGNQIYTVASGTILDWPESGFIFNFDDFVGITSDIQAWWSINAIPRGWFYGYNPTTEVAHVTGITDICEINDATQYVYDPWVVGPVDVGDYTVFRNTVTGFYAAFRVDAIYASQPFASADVSWYLQENGGADFGPCAVPASFSISPATGNYVSTQAFDLTLIARSSSGQTVTGLNATFNGVNVSSLLLSCVQAGTLLAGGQTFRCPNVTGAFLGEGVNSLNVTIDLSDGSQISESVVWTVEGNIE